MANRIKVGFGIKPITYRSFAEAACDRRSERSEDLIRKEVLKSYVFDGKTLVCEFQNGLNLTVSCGDNKIDWFISKAKPALAAARIGPTEFELPGGTRTVWMLTSILDRFLGERVAVFPSEQLLFLYGQDSPEYMFDFYTDTAATNIRYLVLAES
ncbi:MAG: hypothetical protein AAFX56_19815 [Pseudomonadota bacterium]